MSAIYNVDDFKKWTKAFSDNEPKRIQAGLTVENIFRDMNNPNRIKVLMSVESMVAAEEYIELVTASRNPDDPDEISPSEVEFWEVYY